MRRIIAVVLTFMAAALLVSCSSGSTVVKNVDSALSQVPGVVSVKTEYKNNAGVSKRITVRITASPDSVLETVLDDSLLAFAGASDSTRGTISVSYYVFPEGDEENGIRPDAFGLGVTPTVQEIRDYASSNG
ncbi:hypothetical protein [Arthrobacter glacialis]|uniref:Uncharacterized protein n=1 Tax=Arthrobacter glacialis TaxID=1664 RepID=A0A2S3ZUW4_ARTGL|nr:hypothetical protein [Arthrobacter glacialis]POH60226.1 hypothetical protein CVS28_04605 [Arthrobacter glacialis]POH73010.1 hypothetical protein CVS27_12650 [Arthrobacter glacialis]